MKRKRPPEWEELDQIKALFELARSVEEYERVDDLFFRVDPRVRAEWLADQEKEPK